MTTGVTTGPLGADFAAPVGDRYFEDYAVGAAYEYGYLQVSEDEIVRFGRDYDPQPIHVDPEFAATGPFGGLIASGWQTCSLMMRMLGDHYLSHVASLASPGIDELRWPAPLRPGDTVRLRATVQEARPSRSKPDRGLIRTRVQLIKGDDQDVLRLLAMNLIGRRPGPRFE